MWDDLSKFLFRSGQMMEQCQVYGCSFLVASLINALDGAVQMAFREPMRRPIIEAFTTLFQLVEVQGEKFAVAPLTGDSSNAVRSINDATAIHAYAYGLPHLPLLAL